MQPKTVTNAQQAIVARKGRRNLACILRRFFDIGLAPSRASAQSVLPHVRYKDTTQKYVGSKSRTNRPTVPAVLPVAWWYISAMGNVELPSAS